MLDLFRRHCWNNFLHSQAKKCLTYAIGAYDEVREEASGSVQLEISDLQRHVSGGFVVFGAIMWRTDRSLSPL